MRAGLGMGIGCHRRPLANERREVRELSETDAIAERHIVTLAGMFRPTIVVLSLPEYPKSV